MKKLSLIAILLLAACNAPTPAPVPTDETPPSEVGNQKVIEFDADTNAAVQEDAMLDDAFVQVSDDMQNAEQQVDPVFEADMDKEFAADMQDTTGAYTAYYDGVIGSGQESVLFFHATWCPACKANDANLTAWYAENAYARSVYKLDYDTNAELKQQFEVTSQDTFVLIDANGTLIEKVTFPTEAKLQELLG